MTFILISALALRFRWTARRASGSTSHCAGWREALLFRADGSSAYFLPVPIGSLVGAFASRKLMCVKQHSWSLGRKPDRDQLTLKVSVVLRYRLIKVEQGAALGGELPGTTAPRRSGSASRRRRREEAR